MANEKNINSRIQHKHDIETNWLKATTFIPKQGELIIYDIDENYNYERIKIGDGTNVVNSLPFITDNVSVDKEDLESFFFIVETIKENDTYYLSGITFEEIIEKFNNGGNMVCHVDGTDYIPLLSVTSYRIIFSGIYNTTSVSLVFNTKGVGTLTSTYLVKDTDISTKANKSEVTTNLRNGKSDGSIRGINTLIEDDSYTMGVNAFAIGNGTKASGKNSFASGQDVEATGSYAHAEGRYTIAAGGAQHVEGVANIEDAEGKYIHIAGNGSFEERSNAYTLDWDGNGWFAGDITVGANKSSVITEEDCIIFSGGTATIFI